MKLQMQKMGCNDARYNDGINNFRIRTLAECVPGKDGKLYFLEFCECDHWQTRKTNKRTGQPLKTPVYEIVKAHSIHLNTQYTNEGASWRNSSLERSFWERHLEFNIENVLSIVNEISAVKYDGIEFV